MITGIRTRFAPTPSGYLHSGNAYSFILTWLYARSSANGYIHLRIDDIDGDRARTEYVEDIFKSLDWLGLDWDGGPQSVDDFYKNHSQHHRVDSYNKLLNELKEHSLLFACNCSRKQVAEQAINGQYNGHCLPLHLPFDAPETAWRMITPEGSSTVAFNDIENAFAPIDLYQTMRHFVVRGKNGVAAYQIASLVDDITYNINFIVRGADLLNSTAAQCYIASKTEATLTFTQTRFLHHGLLLGADGEKLSKSKGSTALVAMRDAGQTAAPVYQQAATMLGLPKANTAAELLVAFKNKNNA